MLTPREMAQAWRERPPSYSPAVWALILALDRPPWPWGEELLAHAFVARAFVRFKRLRQALAWAHAQSARGGARWSLARSLCAFHGRFVARSALVGIRDAEALRGLVRVEGEAHLAAVGRSVILLGFHLGPAGSYLAMRVAGHRLMWIGGRGASAAWSKQIRDRYQDPHERRFFSTDRTAWLQRLYHARQLLLEGEHVFISADGEGRAAFSVPLPGGPVMMGAGWIALCRATGAPVLPVLAHMHERAQVVTIHPPLPALGAGATPDLEPCRRALARLLGDHVERFPEQCYSLAFSAPVAARSRPAALRRSESVP
jgi:lauroyl/myristoyl acyltransferase